MIYTSHYARELFKLITEFEMKRENLDHVKNMREEYRMIMELNEPNHMRYFKPIQNTKLKKTWKATLVIVEQHQ